MPAGDGFRWRLADDDGGQPMLFAEEDLVERHVGIGEYRGLEFLHVNANRVINRVPASSRMPFRYTINAYRGCSHACGYCFARPTHEYLGLNTGKDFETKLVVKVNAIDKVRAELRSPKWQGDVIAMGTNTDPYQRAEGKYHLTRGIVAALADSANPFSILTKSPLILRDLDQLVRASKTTDVHCALSIGTLDEEVWKATEPGAPHPRKRVDAVRRLADAGIATSVLVAPIIPGWSDRPEQLEAVADACLEAGAQSVTPIVLHLRPGVKEHFLGVLDETDPERAEQLWALYPGAYLSRHRQSVITDLVHEAARRHPSTGSANMTGCPDLPLPGSSTSTA